MMFVGALLLAYASVSLILDKYILQQAETALDTTQLHDEFMTKYAIANIENLDTENYESIYRISCLILDSKAESLDVSIYNSASLKQQEISDLKNKAVELKNRLHEQGLCPDAK